MNAHTIIPAPSSKIAATCTRDITPALLFVYQDEKNIFNVYNSTEDTITSIPCNPIASSGVSLSFVQLDHYPNQLRLYYQIASGNLVAAEWVSPPQFADARTYILYVSFLLLCPCTSDRTGLERYDPSGVSGNSAGWNLYETRPLGQFDMTAPVASFPFSTTADWVESYGNVTGLPYLVAAAMSGSSGLTMVEWLVAVISTTTRFH